MLRKVLQCKFEECLEPMNTLTLEGYSKTVAFEHGRNQTYWGKCIPKYLICEAELFFQNAHNFV